MSFGLLKWICLGLLKKGVGTFHGKRNSKIRYFIFFLRQLKVLG